MNHGGCSSASCSVMVPVPKGGVGAGGLSGLNFSMNLALGMGGGSVDAVESLTLDQGPTKKKNRKKTVGKKEAVSTYDKEKAEKRKQMNDYLDLHQDQIIPVANDVLDAIVTEILPAASVRLTLILHIIVVLIEPSDGGFGFTFQLPVVARNCGGAALGIWSASRSRRVGHC